MGWVELILSIGLRVPTKTDLMENIKSCLPEGKDPELLLTPLDIDLKNTELGGINQGYETIDEEEFQKYSEGSEYSLIWYNGLVLDCSNGFKLDANRCYNGGHMEVRHGMYNDELTLSDIQKNTLKRIAKKLKVKFELSFSLRSRGSYFCSIRFD